MERKALRYCRNRLKSYRRGERYKCTKGGAFRGWREEGGGGEGRRKWGMDEGKRRKERKGGRGQMETF